MDGTRVAHIGSTKASIDEGPRMTRRVALTLCATIAVLAIPAIAQADYGDRCPASGSLTTIFGTDGPDSSLTGFVGTSGVDVMFAFAGDDILWGGPSTDDLCGAKGDDRIVGGDERRGGETSYGDWIFGQGGSDTIRAGGGHDIVRGGGGAEDITAGTGNDFVDGGGGPDVIKGGPQADEIHGGTGDDTIRAGGSQVDHVFGDEGIDTCIVDELDVVESCEIIEVV
jgi:Ca2+-binding RTX toxin-like protein